MSKISIKPADTGTATFTIEAPATNTNRTLTLPDEAGSILTSAGVPASAMPAGSVIQVVGTYKLNTGLETNSTTPADIPGAEITITPTSTASKIICRWSIHVYGRDGAGWRSLNILGLADSNIIYDDGNTYSWAFNGVTDHRVMSWHTQAFQHLPSTTSPVTYKLQAKKSPQDQTSNVIALNTFSYGFFEVMEIAG